MRTRTWLAAVTVLATVAAGSPAVAAVSQDTVGVVDQTTGIWYLRGPAGGTTLFYYGNPGDYPMVGDWDCDTIDTPGLYRQSDGYVYLRNSNTQGNADIRFFFGNPGDIPLAGDFNGDGCDTVSIYRPSEGRVFVINQLGANDGGLGAAEFDYYFGNPGDKPFTGDFNNNEQDTIGLHRELTGLVYFRNTHTQGIADYSFIYGDPGDKIIAGRWVQDPTPGGDTVGIFRPSNGTVYLRFSNTQGNADTQFEYGNRYMLPVAGNFGSLPGGDDAPPSRPVGEQALVVGVVDGDTIDVQVGGVTESVRLIGIDAQEAGECYYQAAKDRLSELVQGKVVTLERDESDRDQFDRLRRYVFLGTEFINATMARGGYVYVGEDPPDNRYLAELEAAAAEANDAELGIWGPCSGDIVIPCDPSYPTACIPSPPPDLDCDDVSSGNFEVLPPDPHGFDTDKDGVGCET